MLRRLILLRGKLPVGEELERLAADLGVSHFNTWVEKHGKTGRLCLAGPSSC